MTKIIAVEGPDRVGKATQVSLLKNYLKRCNKSVLVMEVPIKGLVTYPLIYLMLKTGLAGFIPNVFQVLQVINRFLFQRLFLPFLENKYDYIIFDRWSLSSLIYGDSTGVNKKLNVRLYQLMRVPDATIIINGPARNEKSRDSFESNKALQAAVSVRYSSWQKKNHQKSRMVGSTGTREEVHKKVISELYDLLGKI